MRYRISAATAHQDHSVSVTWSDGVTARVDLQPAIAIGPVFAPLRNPAYFATEMRVAEDQLGLVWPDNVDFSADGLRFRAFPEEGLAEFATHRAKATA